MVLTCVLTTALRKERPKSALRARSDSSSKPLADMNIDLTSILPQLLPKAIEWAETMSSEILSTGTPLSEPEIRLARAVGVTNPERIRVSMVPALPLPVDPELRAIALQTGLLSPGMVGLTLGHGIYVCDGYVSSRLISHECRHVYQYEMAGSIKDFIPVYLQQIAMFGYADAPLEIDAREHEIDVA